MAAPILRARGRSVVVWTLDDLKPILGDELQSTRDEQIPSRPELLLILGPFVLTLRLYPKGFIVVT
jgi:hypothetical protein